MAGMLTLIISTYFASILMVAGCVKFNDPEYFAATLRAVKLLPTLGINLAVKLIPLFEILLAVTLISGVMQTTAALINLVLFTGFLVIKLYVFYQKFPADCGCFGSAYRAKVDPVNLTVSAVLVALATLYFWLTIWAESASMTVRLGALALLAAIGCLMLIRVIQRRTSLSWPNRL